MLISGFSVCVVQLFLVFVTLLVEYIIGTPLDPLQHLKGKNTKKKTKVLIKIDMCVKYGLIIEYINVKNLLIKS